MVVDKWRVLLNLKNYRKLQIGNTCTGTGECGADFQPYGVARGLAPHDCEAYLIKAEVKQDAKP